MNITWKAYQLALISSALSCVCLNSYAASPALGTLNVSAIVAHSCTIGTSNLSFGTYDPSSSTLNTVAGAIALNCSKGTQITNISLGNGAHFANATRNMLGATSGDSLAYNVFQPTGATFGTTPSGGNCTTLGPAWASGTPWTPPASPNNTFSTTTTTNVAVCGQIPINQSVGADASYLDNVAITVNYS